MHGNDQTELQTNPISRLLDGHVLSAEALDRCRNNLEALQNLRYLILLESHDSKQVKLHLRTMDWHIRNLSDTLFMPAVGEDPDLL